MNEKSTFLGKFSLVIVGALFLLTYLLGTFMPSVWWANHWVAFLDRPVQYAFLTIGGLLLFSPYLLSQGIKISGIAKPTKWTSIGIAVLAAVLMYLFPIAHDFYGDAVKLIDLMDVRIQSIPEGTHEGFFSFGLSPRSGFQTVMSMVTYIAYFAGISYREAFAIFDAVCGGLFVWVWLSFLGWYFKATGLRILLGLAGITAPFMLIFFGHFESYAPIFIGFLWLSTSIVKQSVSPSRSRLLGIGAILILCIKLHPVALLFIPAIGILGLQFYAKETLFAKRLGTWKGVSMYMLLPIFIVGAILYFFVFKDHIDGRALNETAFEFDHLFLPLFSPSPPLNTYNLLSINHIFDFFSIIFIWSPISLLIIVVAVIGSRKTINWNSTSLIIAGLNLILFVSLFFMLNPLLSMQMDWDLMSIPAIPFLCFAAVLAKESKVSFPVNKLVLMACGIAVLCVPAFYLHTKTPLIASRLEQLGIRIYHSYYEWSSTIIQQGLDLNTYPDREQYLARKEAILEELEPYAKPGIDFEYARLFTTEGKFYLRKSKNISVAIPYLQEAEKYNPEGRNIILYLMEAHFFSRSYQEALKYSRLLIKKEYPSLPKALSIGINCAIEAKEFDEAKRFCEQAISQEVVDPVIVEIHQKLLVNDTLNLSEYFKN